MRLLHLVDLPLHQVTSWLRVFGAQTLLHDLLEALEGPAQDEEDVGRVDLDEFLVRVFPSALGRHRRLGALEDLQQGLLDALARDVTRRRGRLGDARGQLVNLVQIGNAALCPFQIAAGG